MPHSALRPAAGFVAAALLTVLLAGCGGGGDALTAPPAGNVGPAGAIVNSADNKATLDVPAGAVSTTIAVSLTPVTSGFQADAQIVAGSTYKLDAPDTALALDATLSIDAPPGSSGAGARAQVQRARPLSVLDPTGLIGCLPAVAPGGQVLPGTVCTYDSFQVSPQGQCPPSVPKKVGSQHVVLPPLVNQFQIFCELPNPAKAQMVALSPNAPASPVPTQFSPIGNRAQAKLSVLNPKIFGILLDKTDPVVQLSTIVTPLGNGMGRLTLTANATDNVGVSKVVFAQTKTLSGGGSVLANFTAPPYTWQSAPMLLTDIYGEVCGAIGCDSNLWYAVATDAAGNDGLGLSGAGAGAPVIDTFIATPAQVPAGGGSVVLSWGVQNAAHLFIDHGVGYVTGLSNVAVNVSVPTTFTLTAINSTANVTATTSVTVMPQPAPTIASFTATPATLPAGGGAVTLAWTTTDANTLSIDSGIGAVSGTSTVVNVAASTTFTLTASNTSGSVTKQASVAVALSNDRFIDVAVGSDANACTQAAPCKSIAKGLSGAPPGAKVFLADGIYGTSTQGAGATIPDGVTLQASNAGGAVLTNIALKAAGSATLSGLVFDAQNFSCTSILANAASGTPTLSLTGVLIKCFGAISLGGNVAATMTPGALPGGVYTSGLGAGFNAIVFLNGTAQLTIQGGIIDGNNLGDPAFGGGLLVATVNSKLTLSGVTLRNRTGTVIAANGNATVVLSNGTLLDAVGAPNPFACASGGAIIMGGPVDLTVDHAQVSNSPSAAICVRNGQTGPSIHLIQSSFANNGAGIGSETGTGSTATVNADTVSFTNNGNGINWSGFGSFDIANSTITGNVVGVQLNSGGAVAASFKLRGSNVASNSDSGLALTGNIATDLGTQASPGLNTFSANTNTGLKLNVGSAAQAVGNTWIAGQQGADANGQYSIAPTWTPVPKTGPANGKNFSILNNGSANF